MAEKSTIARPYAQAAFELAKESGELAKWSEMLQFAAQVATDPAMQAYIDNPRVSDARLSELLIDICGDQLNDAGKSFVRVLVENHRLAVLAEIATLYEQHRAEAESKIEAEVVSAFPVSDEQRQALEQALKKRLGREVSLTTRIDESLIGGAIVRAGDLVIDGSVTGHLDKLASALMH
jgi:F-type H+-transporting ATPase subunit delta